MKRSPALALSFTALFFGCSSTPEIQENVAQYVVLAHTGRVIDRVTVPGGNGRGGGSSTVVPIFIGGMFIPIVNRPQSGLSTLETSNPGFHIYEVKLEGLGARKVRVASRGEIPAGTCVDVMVKTLQEGVSSYPAGEAALRASAACK